MSDEVSLDEINVMIAEQKGVTLDELSIKSDMPHMQRKTNVQDISVKDHSGNHPRVAEKQKEYPEIPRESPTVAKSSPADLRGEAEKLLLEAAKLQKMADELEAPKKKISAKSKQKTTKSEYN